MKLLRMIFEIFRNLFVSGLPASTPETTRPAPQNRWRRPVVHATRWEGSQRPPPLMWKDCSPRTRAVFKAEFTCNNGHGVSLRSHAIAADGTVHPSVVCLAPGCSFHDFVRLQGWTAGSI